jgi:hypothetical protein
MEALAPRPLFSQSPAPRAFYSAGVWMKRRLKINGQGFAVVRRRVS